MNDGEKKEDRKETDACETIGTGEGGMDAVLAGRDTTVPRSVAACTCACHSTLNQRGHQL